MSGIDISMHDVAKRYGARTVLSLEQLEMQAGRYTCIMGPSGGGKSTLLRIIGGHERPDRGRVLLGGQDVSHLPPETRQVQTVFQGSALFPALSVRDNVSFAGLVRNEAVATRRHRADELLVRLGLDPQRYGDRNVGLLSGGERQRVALARCLYAPPRVLLLDEPLSALDRQVRIELRSVLRQLQRDLDLTFVHVTHDADEALGLADDLVVLIEGRCVAQGEPPRLYAAPPSEAVARLMGELSPLPDGSFARPECLKLRGDTKGAFPVRERARRQAGPWIELELVWDGGVTWARTREAPDRVESLDVAALDVLRFAR